MMVGDFKLAQARARGVGFVSSGAMDDGIEVTDGWKRLLCF